MPHLKTHKRFHIWFFVWWDHPCKIFSIFSYFCKYVLINTGISTNLQVRYHQVNLLRYTQACHKKLAKWRLSRGWKRLIGFRILAGLQNWFGWGSVLSTEQEGQDNSIGPEWRYLLLQVFVASFHSFRTALTDFSWVMSPSLCSIRFSNCYGLLMQKDVPWIF